MVRSVKLLSLSVFYPCYNEDENIPLFVKQASEFLSTIAKKYEIIIINDGSSDNTVAVTKKLMKSNKNLRLINHKRNRGYGGALRTGFRESKYDWIFFTDGDLQFDIYQLKKFIKYTDTFEVIIGYRINRYEGGLRSLNAWLWKIYVDILYRIGVKDIDCAFKLFKADVVKDLKLLSSGAFLTSELLYKLKKRGVKFKEIPVEHHPRLYGEATGANLSVIYTALRDSILLYLKIKFGRFWMKDSKK